MDKKEPRKDIKISAAASRSLDELADLWRISRKEACELAIVLMQKRGGNFAGDLKKSEELLQRMLGVVEQW